MSRHEFKDTLMTTRTRNIRNGTTKTEKKWIVSGGQVGDFLEE
jgi:hypothetical protein